MYSLETHVEDIKGVGDVIASYLSSLDIHTVRDLIYHIPFRYDHLVGTFSIASLPIDELISIEAQVTSLTKFKSRRGLSIVKATITDTTGKLDVMWFNQEYILLTLKKGNTYIFTGKVKVYKGKQTLSNPQISSHIQIDKQESSGEKFIPIYAASSDISPRKLNKLIIHVLDNLPEISDVHSDTFLKKHHLPSLNETIRYLHQPENPENTKQYTHRLAFDEVFSLLKKAKQEKEKQQTLHGFELKVTPKDVEKFQKALPYTLTQSQLQVLFDLSLDLTKRYPAHRLIQGEVGSGKTTIAAFALYISILNGYDGVLLAPTQIVARQHTEVLKSIFTSVKIRVQEVIMGSEIKEQHDPTIYVGTHALFSHTKKIHPSVVVIDEEHRFGVNQRDIFIQDKTQVPHMITMTATPIPRTAALTFYADQDVSYLSEIPEKKKNIITKVVDKLHRKKAYEWIDEQILTHHTQVFVVCPFISASEKENLDLVASVEQTYTSIVKLFPHRRVALLHGKMSAQEKTDTFSQMQKGSIDILVSTPLIEVGIDIKQASIIVIEGAERFGLAQLHQLRGRVGRAGQKAYCLLFTTEGKEATQRLKALEKYSDGNALAELDLSLRGSGQLFGTSQHGWDGLRFASLFNKSLIEEVKEIVEEEASLDHP